MSPVEVLTNPDGFFRRAGDDPALSKSLGVVLLAGLFGAVAAAPIFQAMQSAMPDQAQGLGTIILVTSIGGAFIGTLIVWVILAALFMAISAIAFDGSGDFSQLLAYVGWGFVPAIINSVIGAAINFYAFQDITVPSVEDPQAIQAWVQSVQNDPLVLTASVIGIAFTLWQAFIWTFAVQHARDISLREAAITVAIPTVLWIGWQVVNLL